MTGGTFSKTMPNHSLFLFLLVHQRDMPQSNTSVTVSHSSLWIQQPTGAPMFCHLLSLPCLVVLRQITRNIPIKKPGPHFYAPWNVPWHLFSVIRAGSLQTKEVK